MLGLGYRRAWVQIAAVTLSGNSLRQTDHTHHASVHQAAKLVAALLRVDGVTAGLAESNLFILFIYEIRTTRQIKTQCKKKKENIQKYTKSTL